MPKKRISETATRKTKPVSSFDFEDPEFLTQVERLAYDGFYDVEIADKLNIDRYEFSRAKSKFKKFTQLMEDARARAREDGSQMPSPARFKEVWDECKGKRSEVIKKFNIGYQTFKQWLKDDHRLIDVMASSDIAFLEQIDLAGRILATGGVKGKDIFPGWNRFPDAWMIRYYLNTIGRRYGYGENPTDDSLQDGIETRASSGIDISNWIIKEMSKKGGKET